MLKKTITAIFWMLIISLWILSFTEASNLKPIWEGKWINEMFTTDNSYIITPPDENPMMEGTHRAVESEESADGSKHQITNISNTDDYYTTQEAAEEGTIKYIHRLINWALAMVSFVALVVLLYAWFQMLTAAGDDAKFKSWKTALKKVTIGIFGIWVSRLIVSLFFYLVESITWNFS